jgi:hypothetical protein
MELSCNGNPKPEDLGLRSLCWHFFSVDMQPGNKIHDPQVDAEWTMKLFTDVYMQLSQEPETKTSANPTNEIQHFQNLCTFCN